MTDRIDQLSEAERRALLGTLLDKQRVTASELSPGQQALWLYQSFHPDSRAYNEAFSFRAPGELDAHTLARSLRALVERHPILRASFASTARGPVQLLGATSPDDLLQVVRIAGLDLAATREQLREAANQPIDLLRGPVFRAVLFSGVAGGDIVLLIAHHLVLDLAAALLAARELGLHYAALARGEQARLPPTIPYQDFVAWQRNLLASERGAALRAYWSDRLRGLCARLELPSEASPGQAPRGGRHTFELGGAELARLKRLAREHQATLFALLQTAYFVLLHRYTGQSDLAVGSPLLGRTRPEFGQTMGHFSNLVCLREDLSGDPRFHTLLARVQAHIAEALDHQDYPAFLCIQDLRLERAVDRSPLYSTLFVWEQPASASLRFEAAPEGAAGGGLALEPLGFEQDEPKAALVFAVCERADRLEVTLSYRADLLDRASIERLGASFVSLLSGLAEAPDQRIQALPIVDATTHGVLLQSWQGAPSPTWPVSSIHEAFERHAQATPDALAILCGDEQVSYGELERRANALAQRLLRAGLAPEQLVGVYGDRGVQLTTALLAVLKAGGSYLPLGPELPEARLRLMIEDADLEIAVASAGRATQLSALAPTLTVIVADSALHEHAPRLERRVNRHDRAYVLYTSGSTGRPKGVEVTHDAVLNVLASMSRQPGFAASDRFLAISSLGFDISVVELFLPLSMGGSVLLADQETVRDPRRMLALMAAGGASCMQATPSYWRLLIDAGWSGDPRMHLIAGGEALTLELADALRLRCASLWNMYGITETTIYSTLCRVTPGGPAGSIGRPLGDTRIAVVDAELKPVPLGVKGEIVIAGRGLARGYLGRPDLTEARFVTADPLDEGRATRLYRTGDVGFLRSDGQLVYCGRSDHQIKLNGQRFELDEVAAHLLSHPEIQDALAMLRSEFEESRLVAYVVPREPSVVTRGVAALSKVLKDHLTALLPRALVPSHFVVLESFPLNSSGKVDRAQLPPPGPDDGASDPSESGRPLAGETELVLGRCWELVLGAPPRDATASFFEQGGTSLAAMNFALEAGKLGLEFAPDNLFAYPTIAELARALERGDAHGRPAGAEQPTTVSPLGA